MRWIFTNNTWNNLTMTSTFWHTKYQFTSLCRRQSLLKKCIWHAFKMHANPRTRRSGMNWLRKKIAQTKVRSDTALWKSGQSTVGPGSSYSNSLQWNRDIKKVNPLSLSCTKSKVTPWSIEGLPVTIEGIPVVTALAPSPGSYWESLLLQSRSRPQLGIFNRHPYFS